MSSTNPIDVLFGEMEKLGPGDDAATLHVLRTLPHHPRGVIVDAGCGTGRQTLVLARQLEGVIQAVDSHQPFLETLKRRAACAGLADRIETHGVDMRDIPRRFPRIDLLWSEGAAYNIGFADALASWAGALVPGGLAVVSELCWLRQDPPREAREFFQSGYPGMTTVAQNTAVAEKAGYRVLGTHLLPGDAWVRGYYDVLEPRAQTLLAHADDAVRDIARGTIQEIDVFRMSEGSYGYVFFVLERP